jgi:hypothetical protein
VLEVKGVSCTRRVETAPFDVTTVITMNGNDLGNGIMDALWGACGGGEKGKSIPFPGPSPGPGPGP